MAVQLNMQHALARLVLQIFPVDAGKFSCSNWHDYWTVKVKVTFAIE